MIYNFTRLTCQKLILGLIVITPIMLLGQPKSGEIGMNPASAEALVEILHDFNQNPLPAVNAGEYIDRTAPCMSTALSTLAAQHQQWKSQKPSIESTGDYVPTADDAEVKAGDPGFLENMSQVIGISKQLKNNLPDLGRRGVFTTSRIMEVFLGSSSYISFVSGLTDKSLGDFSGTNSKLLRQLYEVLKPIDMNRVQSKEDWRPFKPIIISLADGISTDEETQGIHYRYYTLSYKGIRRGKILWEVDLQYSNYADCGNGGSIESMMVSIKTILTSNIVDGSDTYSLAFENSSPASVEILSLSCCNNAGDPVGGNSLGLLEEEGMDFEEEGNGGELEYIRDTLSPQSLPMHFVGVKAGYSYSSFSEFNNFCIGFNYQGALGEPFSNLNIQAMLGLGLDYEYGLKINDAERNSNHLGSIVPALQFYVPISDGLFLTLGGEFPIGIGHIRFQDKNRNNLVTRTQTRLIELQGNVGLAFNVGNINIQARADIASASRYGTRPKSESPQEFAFTQGIDFLLNKGMPISVSVNLPIY